MYIYGHEDGKKGGKIGAVIICLVLAEARPWPGREGRRHGFWSREISAERGNGVSVQGTGSEEVRGERERERETERVCVVVMRLATAFVSPPRSGRHTLPTYKQSRGGQQQQQRGRRGGVCGQNKDSDPRPGRRGPPRCRRSRRGSPSRHGSRRAPARGRKHVNETACRQQGRARGA